MRLNCCIPGCRRGTSKFEDSDEVICGKCWRWVPRATKARQRRIRRLMDRVNSDWEARGPQWTAADVAHAERVWAMGAKVWALAKRQAVKRMAGL